jgi:hypothetical protein
MMAEGDAMRFRLPAILMLALILSLGLPGAPAVIRGRSPLSLSECSPPPGLELPAGQGLAVRCRVHGASPLIHVEFLVNQVVQHTAEVRPGEIVSWTWVPARPGRYTLAVVACGRACSAGVWTAKGTKRAKDAKGTGGREYSAGGQGYLAGVSRRVWVVPGALPVRIP